MASLYADRVQETSTVVGTGSIVLAGATSPATRAFAIAFADGALVSYSMFNTIDSTQWETGIGTFNAGTNSIARAYVLSGSNGSSPVNFGEGSKIVTSVAPPTKKGEPYSATAVNVPGDVVQSAGAAWYALQVSIGVPPSSTSAAWAMLGGTSAGATGPQGPAGTPGQIRFTGSGPPPAVISGAAPGDLYLDVTTGNEYQLS